MRRNVNIYAKNPEYVELRKWLATTLEGDEDQLEVDEEGWPTPAQVERARAAAKADDMPRRRRWLEAAIYEVVAAAKAAS